MTVDTSAQSSLRLIIVVIVVLKNITMKKEPFQNLYIFGPCESFVSYLFMFSVFVVENIAYFKTTVFQDVVFHFMQNSFRNICIDATFKNEQQIYFVFSMHLSSSIAYIEKVMI